MAANGRALRERERQEKPFPPITEKRRQVFPVTPGFAAEQHEAAEAVEVAVPEMVPALAVVAIARTAVVAAVVPVPSAAALGEPD